MFGVILNSAVILACLWLGVTSAISAYRYRERLLGLLALSALCIIVGQAIPLVNLLIGGFGSSMEAWIFGQLAIWLLGISGMAIFNLLGGLQILRRKGLTLKRILLLQNHS